MSLASAVNAVGNIANTLFDQTPKEFYSIRDFYTFIKKRQNAPMAMRHFAIVPKCQTFSVNGTLPKVWNSIFTDGNLARFALLAQSTRLPSLTVQGNQNRIFPSPHGAYSFMAAGAPTSNENSFTMKFLETANSVIETFIVPWYYECLRTSNYMSDTTEDSNIISQGIDALKNGAKDLANKGLNAVGITKFGFKKDDKNASKDITQYPCPKLTLDFKFYQQNEISGLQLMMNPCYIYRITGVYPIQIQPPEATHNGTNVELNLRRDVTFHFNNIICMPNATYEETLFNGGHSAFAYKTQSPVQILNSLNSGVQDVAGIVNSIKSI